MSAAKHCTPPNPVVRWLPPEPTIVVAEVPGQPALVISGISDGELTLYRRGGGAVQALARFTMDFDGSLRRPDGTFLGQVYANDTADLHPDWLRSIGAAEVLLAGAEPDEPAERQLEEDMQRLDQQLDLSAGRPQPAPGELLGEEPPPVLRPPVPFVPLPPAAPRSGKPGAPTGAAEAPGEAASASPAGRPGPAAPGQVPLGFPDAESFAGFGRRLHAGLEAAGYPDVYAAMRGSAVTGKNFRTHEPFDAGRASDLDVALASPSLFQGAKDLGMKLWSGGHRTQPLSTGICENWGSLALYKPFAGRRVARSPS